MIIPNANNLIEVPETIVETASLQLEANNSYERLLNSGKIFKNAKMTPKYLYDDQLCIMYCVAEETFGKKLH